MRIDWRPGLVRAVFFEHVPHHLEQSAGSGDDRALRRFVGAALGEVCAEIGVESDRHPGRFHQRPAQRDQRQLSWPASCLTENSYSNLTVLPHTKRLLPLDLSGDRRCLYILANQGCFGARHLDACGRENQPFHLLVTP
jgi:hypothetical protein